MELLGLEELAQVELVKCSRRRWWLLPPFTLSGAHFFTNDSARVITCPKPLSPYQLSEVKVQDRSSLLDHTNSFYNDKEGSWKWQGVLCLYKHCSLIPTICWHWSKTWLDTNAITIRLRVMQLKIKEVHQIICIFTTDIFFLLDFSTSGLKFPC